MTDWWRHHSAESGHDGWAGRPPGPTQARNVVSIRQVSTQQACSVLGHDVGPVKKHVRHVKGCPTERRIGSTACVVGLDERPGGSYLVRLFQSCPGTIPRSESARDNERPALATMGIRRPRGDLDGRPSCGHATTSSGALCTGLTRLLASRAVNLSLARHHFSVEERHPLVPSHHHFRWRCTRKVALVLPADDPSVATELPHW